ALADDLTAAVVLDRPGEDLAGRGRAAVDQDDDREVGRQATRLDRVALPLAPGVLLEQDVAVAQELAGRRDDLIELSARVVAEVDDQRLGAFAARAADGRLQLVGRRPDEAVDPD